MLAAPLLFLVGSCTDEQPTQPLPNHPPRILSVSVIPDSIGLADSSLVICHAVDPDGDILVYDWITHIPLKLAGAAPEDEYLFGTASNTRALYYAGPDSIATSVRTQVFTRDSHGLQDGVEFYVFLKN